MTLFNVLFELLVYADVCNKEDIILGLVSVINSLSEGETKNQLITKTCSPFATKILEDAKLIPGTEIEEVDQKAQKLSLSRVARNLEKLSLIVKSLTPVEDDAKSHMVVGILEEMWPLLENFLIRFYVKFHHPRICRVW